MSPEQREALDELTKKSLKDIQVETARKWAYRAWAARSFSEWAKNPGAREKWLHDATEYEHEALEHAALSGDDALLAEVRRLVRGD
jgi:hypothetical protein